MTGSGPLAGVRVLELGSFIAGPFAGQLLADYGAEVVKIEAPGVGDAMRTWGVTRDGTSLWWPAISRDKRSVTIDLRTDRGQDLARRLAASCDIVIENFRPGTLAGWGLDYATLEAINPRLILVHVSGFGQDGPYSDQPGFGSVGEAMGGLRYTTGMPDGPPVRSGISLGDSLAALFAVIGATAALNERATSGHGQEVDVAIYEAVLALMESTLADFALGDVVRMRSGPVLPGVAPSNVYPTTDGVDVVIAANADSVFARLLTAIDRPDLVDDPRFGSHQNRGRHADELDAIIAKWTSAHSHDFVIEQLRLHKVPVGSINNARTMFDDVHIQARHMILWRDSAQGWSVPMNGIVPKFLRTPGAVTGAGPTLGQHTDQILRELAGVDAAELARLRAEAVI